MLNERSVNLRANAYVRHSRGGLNIFDHGELFDDLRPAREFVHPPTTQFRVGALQDLREDTENVI
jgi:hypothetical protein